VTEAVPKRAGRQQERGKDESVAIDHPLQRGKSPAELRLQFDEGDVDDANIEDDDDKAEARGEKCEPSAGGHGLTVHPGNEEGPTRFPCRPHIRDIGEGCIPRHTTGNCAAEGVV
jgi:hypothetical protein